MKRLFFLGLLATVTLFAACDKDNDEDHATDYDYHAHIHSPNTDARVMDETINIEVDFESHTGESVHHVKVRIYNKDSNTEVFNMPTTAHVHAESGTYTFDEDLVLSTSNGFAAGTWVLEASVWGHDGMDDGLATEMLEFVIN